MFPVFWAGPRLCLGKDMARLEVINVAQTLLQSYHFEVLPHSEQTVMLMLYVIFWEEIVF
jgi:cytochrome P450